MSVTTLWAASIAKRLEQNTTDSLMTTVLAASNLHVSLHDGDPGVSGSQTTSEVDYTGYARVAVARTSSGWAVSGATTDNVEELNFGKCTANPGSNITHVGIGTDSTGAGNLLYFGPLDDEIPMVVGATPIFSAGDLDRVIT